ncbi:fibrous sheath-interacting protein 1-like [Acipenser ruthenus]|uniref:fibrous sheath-interacting protein 1-like n=1 Tax=Acipenser ruthenus TaxID=7906 RepID=UPI00145AF5E9|nr:fibrous sheath-interacting protein 1-like [Acipenser ruthenus]
MDILKGSLEEISRPASSARSRPGSRASNMLVQDRLRVSVACLGSLEVLTAESGGSQDRSSDLEDLLCPPGSSADFSGDELSCESEGANPISTQKTEPPKRQLHLLSEEKVSCILQGVQNPSSNTEHNSSSADSQDNDEIKGSGSSKPDGSDEENKDPRLQEAIQKMKKLDKILASKVSREREIKKQGKELRIQLWEELQSTKHEGLSESHDELENTRRFLSLTPTYASAAIEDVHFVPLFDTQIPAEEYKSDFSQTEEDDQSESTNTSKTSRDTDQTDQSANRQRGVNKSKKKQDFVKKNIELAKDAGNAVLMTDDEKRRLAELLKDIGEDGSTNLPSDEGNPSQWAVSLTPGEGYTPEPSELHHLTEIDSKLQALLSAEDYSALHSPYSSCRQLQECLASSDNKETLPGEKVLLDTKESRGYETRLREIEQQLGHLDTELQSALERPSLTENQLKSLLEECMQAQNRTGSVSLTEDPSTRPQSSASSVSCLVVPATPSTVHSTPRLVSATPSTVHSTPRLSDSMLSLLLEEAGWSRTSTAREGEQNGERGAEHLQDGSSLSEKLLTELDGKEAGSAAADGSYMAQALRRTGVKRPPFLDDPSYTSSDSVDRPTDEADISAETGAETEEGPV